MMTAVSWPSSGDPVPDVVDPVVVGLDEDVDDSLVSEVVVVGSAVVDGLALVDVGRVVVA